MRVLGGGVVLLCALACGIGKQGESGMKWSEPMTLVSVVAGDASCYVTLRKADGVEVPYDGSFDLCPGAPSDATGWIGHEVVAELVIEGVMAGSCEGDPECADKEYVTFVKALALAH